VSGETVISWPERGLGIRLVKRALRPLIVRFHQGWLEGLSRVALQGAPPAA
jgi:hypothetical protein